MVERATGFEPATSSLGSWHSATELRPLDASQSYSAFPAAGSRYFPFLSDIVKAWMTSSLRAFQLRRLLTP
jgi:hypothetical protein